MANWASWSSSWEKFEACRYTQNTTQTLQANFKSWCLYDWFPISELKQYCAVSHSVDTKGQRTSWPAASGALAKKEGCSVKRTHMYPGHSKRHHQQQLYCGRYGGNEIELGTRKTRLQMSALPSWQALIDTSFIWCRNWGWAAEQDRSECVPETRSGTTSRASMRPHCFAAGAQCRCSSTHLMYSQPFTAVPEEAGVLGGCTHV